MDIQSLLTGEDPGFVVPLGLQPLPLVSFLCPSPSTVICPFSLLGSPVGSGRVCLTQTEREQWPSLLQNLSLHLSQCQKYSMSLSCFGGQPCSPLDYLCPPKTMCLPLCRKEVNRNIISILGGRAVGGPQCQEGLRVSGQGT